MSMHGMLECAFARVQGDGLFHVEGLLNFGLLLPHFLQEWCVESDYETRMQMKLNTS